MTTHTQLRYAKSRTVVPRAGLEPAQVYTRRILSPLRLPFRHLGISILYNFKYFNLRISKKLIFFSDSCYNHAIIRIWRSKITKNICSPASPKGYATTVLTGDSQTKPRKRRRLEAAPGFEPGVTVLQTIALPLGYAALYHY